MNEKQFSPEAAILWSAVPPSAREQILKNVFCVKCCGAAEMVNFRGEEKKGDLMLTGKCAKCGHEVVRVIETSELSSERN